jgi:hypothetical protein
MFVLIVMGMVGTPKDSVTPGYAPVLRHGFRTARPRAKNVWRPLLPSSLRGEGPK